MATRGADAIVCRLFGLRAAEPVHATFWLLDAPDSLAAQSHREPDGAGIGIFDSADAPIIEKRPLAAWEDARFAAEARELRSATFVAHVRYASTGDVTVANTHPFSADGRIFAHNGAFAGLDVLERRLTELGAMSLVAGQTDSERMFALITAETRAANGAVSAGLVNALSWLVSELPVYSLNLILAAPHRMWAVRYPDTNELWLLRRDAGGHHGQDPLDASSRRIHARSEDLERRRSVVIASEPMDDDPDWRLLEPGVLVTVEPDLSVRSTIALPSPPRYRLTHADLDASHSVAHNHTRPPE